MKIEKNSNNKMYLVTGAEGFWGGTVCRQLVERGDRVRAFVLPNDRSMKYVPREAEIVEGDLCDVHDLARSTILAADKGKKGECYVFGNSEVTFRQVSQTLVKECGCKPMKMFLPLCLANFMAGTMEKKAKKDGSHPMMTTFSVYPLARNNDFDSSKAKRELGYTTRSYEETIHDMVEWLKKTGKIADHSKAANARNKRNVRAKK